MRKSLVVALASALVLVVPAVAHADVVEIARSSDRGPFSYTSAIGDVDAPLAMWMKVKAKDHQRVFGEWSLSCWNDEFDFGSLDGTLRGKAPEKEAMTIPVTAPTECSYYATAELKPNSDDKVTLIILADV